MKYYTATKSRNAGRESWSVIFRHPARLDGDTGKTGRRVRRGLGTTDDGEATRLIDELNEILSTPELWEPSSRGAATARFDPRVVDIFYDGLEATRVDYAALRDLAIPQPTRDDGYRTVLLLGTTGAGKTTVVRQLLGTDPTTERFPSTSTAKTTVADTELITTADGPFKAVVTFVPRDEVIDYLTENVSAAALAAYRGRPDEEVSRRLLDHVDQRFRFSYVLGRVSSADPEDIVDDDDDDIEDDVDPEEYGQVDLGMTAKVVADAVVAVKDVVARHAKDVVETLADIEDDERVVAEYVEEQLDSDLRQTDEFHAIVDALVDEIEKRFTALEIGELKRSRQGWPLTWQWESDDRAAFVKVVSRFSSNYAKIFGRLLTPLVNGIRVSGPFGPEWASESVRLVLIDGEGLGHTPKSVATLSTHVATQLQAVDSVILVDSAAQPMQAAPVAALKGIAVSGNAPKLHVVFTHFDQVKGPNLPTFSAREEHVLASVENVLKAIGDELGPAAGRALRRRFDSASFFVGGIQEKLDPARKSSIRSIDQLDALLNLLAHPELATEAGESRPVFDRMNLSLAVAEAATTFHSRWRGLLGLEQNLDAPKEHWARVKALSRRLAEGWSDEYDNLKPVADLRYNLQMQLYLMLQRPVRWDGGEPGDDEKQAVIDALSNAVTNRLVDLSKRRLGEDVQRGWQEAYAQHGRGSTFERARIIASEVYDRGVPVPTVSASPDQNRFLKDIAKLVGDVAEEHGVVLE
ncbi:ATP-binding protein [Kribbella turkmenica]|uniref:ATP-binding protein n=1 Tax=Kribbella turkmenica TaxID=2530375 RepID=A0A4R4WT55_9ACTN|nr:ATP-binding protein [Kribbella turkmenica]TDD20772.1 ATP-binding protein [Kribbella turkmenica]